MALEDVNTSFLVWLMKDIPIEENIKIVLGAKFHDSHTWGDVVNRMNAPSDDGIGTVEDELERNVVLSVEQTLYDEVRAMTDREKVARAARYGLVAQIHQKTTDPRVHRQSLTKQTQAVGKEANKVGNEEGLAKVVQYDNSGDMKGDEGKGHTTTVVTPMRGYKDSRGNDHGKAMREQLLNPRPDPWASI